MLFIENISDLKIIAGGCDNPCEELLTIPDYIPQEWHHLYLLWLKLNYSHFPYSVKSYYS
jgi:hypothetical protein